MADEQQHLTKEEEKKLETLHAELSKPQAKTAELTGADPRVEACAIWKKIKPYWPIIVKAARMIPVVGNTVAGILDLLGGFLDKLCP